MHIWAGPRDQKWKKGKIIIPFHLSGISPVFQILGGIHPIKISSLSEAGALQKLAKVTNSSGDLCCCLNVPVATTFSQHDLLIISMAAWKAHLPAGPWQTAEAIPPFS